MVAKVTHGPNGVPAPDFGIEIAKGCIDGHTVVNKFGYNADIDIAEEDIWTVGGAYAFPSDSGIAMQIVSTLGDTVDVVVEGLDENFDAKTQLVTLTGATAVSLTGLWSRVFRAFVFDSTAATGVITVEDDATGTVVYAEILPIDQQTNMMIWTVPAGHTAYVKLLASTFNKTGGANNSAIIRLRLRTFGKVFRTAVRWGLQSGGGQLVTENITPGAIPEKTDVIVSAATTAADSDVSAFVSFIVVEDRLLR